MRGREKAVAPAQEGEMLRSLLAPEYCALDFLPESSREQRLLSLVLDKRERNLSHSLTSLCKTFGQLVDQCDTSQVKIVVFGGGTGLSTIVGGDSRKEDWPDRPFIGLKEVFTQLYSVVCVTDDGGSTGELRKDLPCIALGDLRHVLLSSIRRSTLIRRYNLVDSQVEQVVTSLHRIFNYRFDHAPLSAEALQQDCGLSSAPLPLRLHDALSTLVLNLFSEPYLRATLQRPHCLGNLLVASAITAHHRQETKSASLLDAPEQLRQATVEGLRRLCPILGVDPEAVLPASLIPAELSILYSNGLLLTSERKSASSRRGYPVDRAILECSAPPVLHPRLPSLIAEADILLFAPGSLFTSIIPILQLPGLAEALRANEHALKVLIANIWVQKGETDTTHGAPQRKFYVSDLIHAYHRNIPGGVKGLFSQIIALDMSDIPGSVLQTYALEEKEPIYVDREQVNQLGLGLVEAAVFSKRLLRRQGLIQHDPESVAKAIKALWMLHKEKLLDEPEQQACFRQNPPPALALHAFRQLPCLRYHQMRALLEDLPFCTLTSPEGDEEAMQSAEAQRLGQWMQEIIWRHPDILCEHLGGIRGLTLVETESWRQAQEWENVFSFYEPKDGYIKMRQDQANDAARFEAALLVALGQSLLGNYALEKRLQPIMFEARPVGLLYSVRICEHKNLRSFLSVEDLRSYLSLARLHPSGHDPRVFTRAINLNEGFTPPGLFFGLVYAWYLDNRLAPTIEYKMSILRQPMSNMIAEQMRMASRRSQTIRFFREKVFRQTPAR